MDIQIDKEFGHRVAELRKQANLTQEELAFRSGMHRAYIGTIERGEKSPTLNTIYKIAKALGIQIKDFFNHATP